ncbi:MAG: hemerythrin family protein [Candidatus Hydrogenedentes bacterium]|nr:hemerythrin family protein [Candidatus Hydrogenedentota bacterium]
MPGVTWSSRFRLGIGEIDEQHHGLFSLANRLDAAVGLGAGQQAVSETLPELIEYVKTHFAAEEALLAETAYPEHAAHQAEHEAFIRKLTGFSQACKSGIPTVPADIVAFVSDWLPAHILGRDKDYVPHLAENGIE